jgi:5-methylcytosine-specific restriction endonuclease McrA
MPYRPPVHQPRRPEAKGARDKAHNAETAFYRSPAWRLLREAVLARDGHRCQVRMFGCAGAATQVDHIVPRRQGGSDTDMSNFRSVCLPCHNRLRAPEHLRVF